MQEWFSEVHMGNPGLGKEVVESCEEQAILSRYVQDQLSVSYMLIFLEGELSCVRNCLC